MDFQNTPPLLPLLIHTLDKYLLRAAGCSFGFSQLSSGQERGMQAGHAVLPRSHKGLASPMLGVPVPAGTFLGPSPQGPRFLLPLASVFSSTEGSL